MARALHRGNTLCSPRGELGSDADEPASAGSWSGPVEEESSPLGRGPNRGPIAEEPEQPGTTSRGVKDDISALTETLARRLWGAASFLAPPLAPTGGLETPAPWRGRSTRGGGGSPCPVRRWWCSSGNNCYDLLHQRALRQMW